MEIGDSDYTDFLKSTEKGFIRKILDVQLPYKWNLRRLNLGKTLDVGCGIGRNLQTLSKESVGVDINRFSVSECRQKGLNAFLPNDFFNLFSAKDSGKNVFDSILFSHVLEHMKESEIPKTIFKYLGFLKNNGKVVFISPQEAGYKNDPTHRTFVDFDYLLRIAIEFRLRLIRKFSFPFPRIFGKIFLYNEFILVLRFLNILAN
ncbi:MAG: class I SAM-dependent methyltransferase [Candidatus Riflebacteria bacterium]|nr:class I SAM-dependent methyltransferase [Candidatus Riflebacteria bacterium]